MNIKTVLVTTDLSDLSKKAFPHARDLAEKYEAKIVVAYVEEYRLPPLVLEYPAVGFEEIARQQREQANERLRRRPTRPVLAATDGLLRGARSAMCGFECRMVEADCRSCPPNESSTTSQYVFQISI